MKMDMIEDIVYDALAHGLKEELLLNVLIYQKNQPHCNLNSVYSQVYSEIKEVHSIDSK
mgnify:FL=1